MWRSRRCVPHPSVRRIAAWGRCDLALDNRGFREDVTRRDQSGRTMSSVPRPAVAFCYGVICHGCFALGVGAMMAAMFFGMSRSLASCKPRGAGPQIASCSCSFPLCIRSCSPRREEPCSPLSHRVAQGPSSRRRHTSSSLHCRSWHCLRCGLQAVRSGGGPMEQRLSS